MLSLLARSYTRNYAMLMALGVVLILLQQVSVQTVLTPAQQTSHVITQPVSEHIDSKQCAANCVSTLQHCCLYPLSSKQALSLFTPNPIPSSTLVYFFTSLAITPQTPPPKTA